MGDRKQPRPVPTNQVKPTPPPAPPAKRVGVVDVRLVPAGDGSEGVYWKLLEDPNWRPYCLACRSMERMRPTAAGFRCYACRMEVDRAMRPLDGRTPEA